eukprot:c17769_g1_i1 orf=90-2927(+)
MAPAKQKKKQKARSIGVDFKRVKHKVGRKLAPASNVTKMEVKSKSIVLPGQSVAQDKEGLSINSRRQTLKELLAQTTHHNDNVRKEALLGIKDLLARHPKELSLHAVTLVEKLCPRITDKNKSVRQALLDLLRTTVFAGLPEVLMRPLIPIVMAYIFSAMTNLAVDIRMSAFGFLDALIHSYPLLVAADYLVQIIQSFVEFLGKLGIAGQTGSQLPEVLDGLLQFLSAVHKRSRFSKIRSSTGAKDGQELTDDSSSSQNGGASLLALHWYKSVVPEVKSSLTLDAGSRSTKQGTNNFSLQLADALVKALLSCWAECAPLVCSGQSPDKDSMECMIKVCGAMHLLLLVIEPGLEQRLCTDPNGKESGMRMQNLGFVSEGSAHQKWIENCAVPLFNRHLIGSFPICAPAINLPKKVEELLLNLNMRIAEVILDSIIAGNLQVQEEHSNVTRLLDYVEDALDGQMLSSLGLSSDSVDKKTTDSYLKLLVTFVPCLLGCISRERQLRMLKAFTRVFQNCKPMSKLKHVCLSCIAEILQPSDSKNGGLEGQGILVADTFEFQKQWLQALPKLLWELKENHCSSSLAILKVLHHLGRSAPGSSPLEGEYTALQPILIPFFSTLHPSKQNQVRRLHGPFMKLPLECQQLAIDLLFYYNRFSNAFLKAIAHCLCPDLQMSLVVRCIEVIQAVYSRGSFELSDYLSFIFTLLMEPAPMQDSCTQAAGIGDPEMDRMPLFQRHRIVTGALCSCLRQIGDGRLVLHLLNPSICHQMVLPLPTLALYGLIKVVAMLGASGKGVFVPKSLFELLPSVLAKYLVSLAMEKCFQKRLNDKVEPLIKPFVHPCLRILSKSAKLTEAVIHQLCTPSNQGTGELLYARIVALLQVLGIEHVCTKLLVNSEDLSSFRRFEGDEWMNIYQLEEGDVLSLFGKLSKAAILAYGWKEGANCSALASD